MRKLAIAVALASTALATPAVARDKSWYVGIDGGILFVDDSEVDVSTSAFGPTYPTFYNQAISIQHNRGVDVDVKAGYDMGWLRLEGELGWKRAGIDNVLGSQQLVSAIVGDRNANGVSDDGFVVSGGDGHGRAYSAMLNALVDFGSDDGFQGSLGGGIGIAGVKYDVTTDPFTYFDRRTNTQFTVDGGSFSDSDSAMAWQGIAEVRYPLTNNIDIGLKGRYFQTMRLEMSDDFIGSGDRFRTKWRSTSLLASLVYNFAPPPPPPPPPPPATQTCPDGSVILATETCPAPAVVQAGPFIVFFDWDKSDITPEAAAILDNAAAAYQQTGSAQVMLAGHADRSGSADYNVGLSQRRADAVRAYLAGRGVADGAMSTSAFGESQPLVQTADGVREPQNRRVEITFGPGSGQ